MTKLYEINYNPRFKAYQSKADVMKGDLPDHEEILAAINFLEKDAIASSVVTNSGIKVQRF